MASLKTLLNELLIFRKHLPKGKVSQQYVAEYNALLTTAQTEIGIDLSRFFIKPGDISRDVVSASFNSIMGASSVGYGTPYLASNFFLMRLESAISHIADELDIDNPLTDL